MLLFGQLARDLSVIILPLPQEARGRVYCNWSKTVHYSFRSGYLAGHRLRVLSRRSWSPATTGPPGPSAANYVAVDGPPGPSMAAMDGPLFRKWSPCSKPEKQWLQLQIDLY